jgi:uncharacterized protein (DUF2235 family)
MLKKDSPAQQMVYYQAGIGTYTIPQIAKPMMAKLHRVMDSMVGVHLNAHVMGEYHSLVAFFFCTLPRVDRYYLIRSIANMPYDSFISEALCV